MSRSERPLDSLAVASQAPSCGVNYPLERSSTFVFSSPEEMEALLSGEPSEQRYIYGRHSSPTLDQLGQQLAALEGTETAVCTSSGMSSIAAVLFQLCEQGDHVVTSKTLYGGTYALLSHFLPRRTGISTTFVDCTALEEVAGAIQPNTRVVLVETMTNPTLRVADIPALARLSHSAGARLVVDNTFCPLIVSPCHWGADVVVYSLTKFFSGASDLLGGAICGAAEFKESLLDLDNGAIMLLGPTMDASAAFTLLSRLPHLGLRMAEHGRRAKVFAQRIEAAGLKVIYPGLPSHPDHNLLVRLANPGTGFGGVLAIDLGTREKASRFMRTLKTLSFGHLAVSLGFHDTLLCRSAGSTASELPAGALEQAGISEGLVRLSVGYTGSLEYRWTQLSQAVRRACRDSGLLTDSIPG